MNNLRQVGSAFSQSYVEQTLRENPRLAVLLIGLFEARFAPAAQGAEPLRTEAVAAADERLERALDDVASLDEDRILRALRSLISATLRTNHFQTDDGAPKPYLAVKIDSRAAPGLPDPRPLTEIWVCSPHVEGVHLRFGRVARGGLRWSDRREDFRTEVLGLVKAQAVKNAVIVPVRLLEEGLQPLHSDVGNTVLCSVVRRSCELTLPARKESQSPVRSNNSPQPKTRYPQ